MKHIVSLSIFLALAVVAWWSITNDYNKSSRINQLRSTDYAEIFMNEFKMTSMNKDGQPNYILQGAYLQRSNNSDDAKIKKPIFQFFQNNKQWNISANNAIINDRKETIQLKNDVLMQQINSEPAVTIRTQNLLIHTKNQTASTDVNVDITHGKSHFTSNGMVFNNTTNELVLSSQVSGQYSPHD